MVELPPIHKSTKQNNQKKQCKRKVHIESKIFKDGATWFDLDTFMDPYSRRWEKYVPLHQQTVDFIASKKELGDKRILFPLLADFNEGPVTQFRVQQPLEERVDLYGRLSQINSKEKTMKEEWKKIEDDELDFSHLVESYNDFIIENKVKRDISLGKIDFYRKKTKDLSRDMKLLMKTNEILRRLISEMKENSDKLLVFYKFCEDAARRERMGTPFLLINRYLSIKEVEDFVQCRLLEKWADFTKTYDLLKKQHTDRYHLIHRLKMQYTEMRFLYEEAFRKTTEAQQFHHRLINRCRETMRKNYQSTQSVSAIYDCVRSRTIKGVYIPKTNVFDRLVFIKRTIEKLEGINTLIKSVENRKGDVINKESFDSVVTTTRKTSRLPDSISEDSDDVVPVFEEKELDEDSVEKPMEPDFFTNFDQKSKTTSFKFSLSSYRTISDKSSVVMTPSEASSYLPPIVYVKKPPEVWVPPKESKLSSYSKRKMYDEDRKKRERKSKSLHPKSSKFSKRKIQKSKNFLPPLIRNEVDRN